MKKSIDEIILDTAKVTASEVVRAQRRAVGANLYRAMERLLRNYKTLARLAASEEDYMLIPERDHSISVAPPPGGVPRDREEIMQDRIDERRASYRRTVEQFNELDAVVRQFADKPEFIVIRMYYFNEDSSGRERSAEARPYSFEEIAEELAVAGLQRSERTLRKWRTDIVRDMTVALFGVDGAVSVEMPREPRPMSQ